MKLTGRRSFQRARILAAASKPLDWLWFVRSCRDLAAKLTTLSNAWAALILLQVAREGPWRRQGRGGPWS